VPTDTPQSESEWTESDWIELRTLNRISTRTTTPCPNAERHLDHDEHAWATAENRVARWCPGWGEPAPSPYLPVLKIEYGDKIVFLLDDSVTFSLSREIRDHYRARFPGIDVDVVPASKGIIHIPAKRTT